jgi:tetratricopeptide (TPR) repeat protein
VDSGRICEIYQGGSRCGSGYLVSDTVVLTAAHVVPGRGGPVRVRLLRGGSGLVDAVVAWCRWDAGDGSTDLALLSITDPAWRSPTGWEPVSWGRLVTARAACEAVGYPQVQRVRDSAGKLVMRDLEHPVGWVSRLTTAKAGTLGVDLTSAAPLPVPDTEPSPWAGMSGAPLFCGAVLVGVLTTHPDGFDTSRLTAAAVTGLLDDPDAAALLAGGSGAPPVPEPAELVPLADRTWPVTSPAGLLRADVEAVPFRGRERLLAQLRLWCESPGRFSARLVSGPGGQGKTRLARELGRRMRQDGWAVLHVAPDLPADHYAALAGVDVPLLVVMDYAETRTAQVGAVVGALRGASGPVRLVLVARTGGEWVDELSFPGAESMIGEALTEIVLPERPADTEPPAGAMPVALPELADTVDERTAMFDAAVAAFAARLGWLPAYRDVDWAAAATAAVRPDLSLGRYDTALAVQMAALAALLDRSGGSQTSPEVVLLVHERRYWRRLATRLGVLDQPGLPDFDRLAGWLVAAAAVCGADTEQEALATLGALPVLAGQPAAVFPALVRWLHELYPAQHAYWASPPPDRLAEHLVATVLTARPDLLDEVLPAAAESQVYRALIVLSRAAIGRPATHDTLRRLVTDHPVELAPAALLVSTAVENPAPLVEAVDSVIDTVIEATGAPDPAPPSPSGLLLSELYHAIPARTQLHRRRAARIASALVEYHRGRDAAYRAAAPRRLLRRRARPTAATLDLAETLLKAAYCHSELGEWAQTLTAVEESSELLDRLAATDPGDYDQQRVEALDARAVTLSSMGRTAEALAAEDQAIALLTALARRDPTGYGIVLGQCHGTRAAMLIRLDRWDEALDALRAASALVHSPTEPDTATTAGVAAFVDTNLTAVLSLLGRQREALAAARQAVDRYRRLAEDRPDSFEPFLTVSLVNLAKTLMETGNADQAVAAAGDAVDRLRRLAAAYPDAYRPHLLMALNNLNGARGLAAPGKLDGQALRDAEEAATGLRELVAERPGVFESDLVVALVNLSGQLSWAGQDARAVEAGTEAVTIGRAHAGRRPDTFEPILANALTNLGTALSELERHDEARPAAEEAVELLRRRAQRHPEIHGRFLVLALHTLGGVLAELDLPGPARAAATEAVSWCRRHRDGAPDPYDQLLGESLANLGVALTHLGQHRQALAADEEARDIFRRLVAREPTRHAEQLVETTRAVVADLTALGRPDQALAACEDTVEHLEGVPPTPGTDQALSTGLLSLSYHLSLARRPAEATAAAEKAVAIRRRTGDTPARLAGALNRVAVRYDETGRPAEAAAARADEISIYRTLVGDGQLSYRSRLASALLDLAVDYVNAGQIDQLRTTAEDAVSEHRTLLAEQPSSDGLGLATALFWLGTAHLTLGTPGPAATALTEAADRLRPLAAAGVDDTPAMLATVLQGQAELHLLGGEPTLALNLLNEVVPVHKGGCTSNTPQARP